jgi:hypothetical protein
MRNANLCSTVLLLVAFLAAACGYRFTDERDVAAPQAYRPKGSEAQWKIEGVIDSQLKHNKASDLVVGVTRKLPVTIDGEKAIEGPLQVDDLGMSTATLDGEFRGAKITADCSTQRKSRTWVELLAPLGLVDRTRHGQRRHELQ